MANGRVCSCGQAITFVRVAGKLVPCDPKATVYEVTASNPGGQLEGVKTNRLLGTNAAAYLANHFSTCPDADHFTRFKSKKQAKVDALVAAVGAIEHRLTPAALKSVDPNLNRALRNALKCRAELLS
jgi:hypothetical protein